MWLGIAKNHIQNSETLGWAHNAKNQNTNETAQQDSSKHVQNKNYSIKTHTSPINQHDCILSLFLLTHKPIQLAAPDLHWACREMSRTLTLWDGHTLNEHHPGQPVHQQQAFPSLITHHSPGDYSSCYLLHVTTGDHYARETKHVCRIKIRSTNTLTLKDTRWQTSCATEIKLEQLDFDKHIN